MSFSIFCFTLWLVFPRSPALDVRGWKDGYPVYNRALKSAATDQGTLHFPFPFKSSPQPAGHGWTISSQRPVLWPSFESLEAVKAVEVRTLPSLAQYLKAWISTSTVVVTPTCVAPAAGVTSLTPCPDSRRSILGTGARTILSGREDFEERAIQLAPRLVFPWVSWSFFKQVTSTASSTSSASLACIPSSLLNLPECPATTPSCSSNTDCSGSTPVCDTNTNVCSPCTVNTQCTGDTPICQTSTGQCVGCDAATDCSGSTNFCDPTTKVCSNCTVSTQCSGTTPICQTSTGRCVGCDSNADCAGSTYLCDPVSKACTSCTSSTQCPTDAPSCGLTGRCMCGGAPDCRGSTSYCDPATMLCSKCTDDSQCPAYAATCQKSTGICLYCPVGCPGRIILGALEDDDSSLLERSRIEKGEIQSAPSFKVTNLTTSSKQCRNE